MPTRGDLHWRWPTQGEALPSVIPRIMSGEPLSPYANHMPPFCYPGTTLTLGAEEADVLTYVTRAHANIIGIHTMCAEGEGGFKSAQELERDVIWMLAGMLGGQPDEVDGFFCQGGTESILQGMWLGREWLRDNMDVEPSGVAVMTSQLHHYSINKAARILGLGYYRLKECPRCHELHHYDYPLPLHGMNLVGINDQGEMSVTDLERQMADLYTFGIRRFLVVATAGTTLMGSIDPIEQIASMTRRFADKRVEFFGERQRPLVYIHVDASFGGFTIPFVDGAPSIGFDIPGVMSVTVDADKMGQLPYPSGVFLCQRRDPAVCYNHPSQDGRRLIDHVSSAVGYVGGHCDHTVPGSRTLIPAAMAWIKWRSLGIEGQRQYVNTCIDQRNRLAHMIRVKFGTSGPVNVLPVSNFTNILPMAVTPPPDSAFSTRSERLAPYELRSDALPYPVDRQIDGCPPQVYKIVVMPHIFDHFDQFINNLSEELKHKAS